MKGSPPRHSHGLLIAWKLAQLEAAHQRATELKPVHFFLALLKLSEIDLKPILNENISLSNQQILEEINSVHLLSYCFANVRLETTLVRRKLRYSLPHADGDLSKEKHISRGKRAREVFQEADALAMKFSSDSVQPLHLLLAIVSSPCSWVAATLDKYGVSVGNLFDIGTAVLCDGSIAKDIDKQDQAIYPRSDIFLN